MNIVEIARFDGSSIARGSHSSGVTKVDYFPTKAYVDNALNYGALFDSNAVLRNYVTSNSWVSATSAADNAWRDICWSRELGLFVAVGSTGSGNRVMTSPNGTTWTTRTSAADNDWYSVDWSPAIGLFAAVASSGTGNRVMTSPDGVNWTARTSAADNSWRSICWSADLGLFVAVAATGTTDRVMTSPDGVNWTIRTAAGSNTWRSVCWARELGLFVAVASTGTTYRVMTSPDGITWTARASATDNDWYSVCWSRELGLLVAVAVTGTGNRVMTSPNGVTWTSRTSAADNDWYAVAWSRELGLLVAVASTGTGSRVMTSPDGVNWTTRTSAADNSWYSICWARELGLFASVGASGSGNRVMTSKSSQSYITVNYPVYPAIGSVTGLGAGVSTALAIAAGLNGGFAIARPDVDVTAAPYSAVGSNTAGDGAKIKSAINTISTTNVVTIRFPDGDFLLDDDSFGYGMLGRQTSGLTIRIIGAGKSKTLLRGAALAKNVLGFANSAKVEISDLTIDASAQTAGSGIYLYDCSFATIEDVDILEPYNCGILFDYRFTKLKVRNVFIDTTRAPTGGSGGHGVALSADNSDGEAFYAGDAWIEGIRVRNPYGSGVNLSGSHDVYVRGVHSYWEGGVQATTYAGVRASNGSRNLQIYDVSSRNMGRGAMIHEARNVVLKNCHSEFSQHEGLLIDSDNSLADNITVYGFYSYNSGQAEASGGTCGITLVENAEPVTNVRIFDARLYSGDSKMVNGIKSNIGTSNLILDEYVDIRGASGADTDIT